MSSPVLYVSDLDGTLLDKSGYLSDRSRAQLLELLAEGIPFTVASARSLVSMKERLGDLPLSLPVVEFNGAYVTDYHTGRKLITHMINPAMVSGIQEVMHQQSVIYFVSSHDGLEDHVYHTSERNGGMDYYLTEREQAGDPRLRTTSDWSEIDRESVVCFTAVDQREPMVQLRHALYDAFGSELTMHLWEDAYATGWHWLMIHHQDACKGKAIRSLMETQGLRDYQLTVFGDQVNDLGMMELADRKIAVANACVEICDFADFVLGPHYDDVVSKFLFEEYEKISQ
ncbi:MAG: HAD-IIB family hydrolase [Verrucomicrobiota bacterium]